MFGNVVLLTRDKWKSEMNDPSKFYGYLRKVKIIGVGYDQTTKAYNGTFSVEELASGVRRDCEAFPIHFISQFMGDGYGAYGMPCVGDIGYIGFLGEGLAVYIGSTPFNLGKQTRDDDSNFNKMRSLTGGEYCIKSKKGAEIYLDDSGAVRIILNDASDSDRPDNYDTKYAELTVDSSGFSYENEKGTITLDSDGKLTVTGTAAEMLGSSALALLSDLNSLITTYNTHSHLTAGTGPPVAPTQQATSATGTTKLKGA